RRAYARQRLGAAADVDRPRVRLDLRRQLLRRLGADEERVGRERVGGDDFREVGGKPRAQPAADQTPKASRCGSRRIAELNIGDVLGLRRLQERGGGTDERRGDELPAGEPDRSHGLWLMANGYGGSWNRLFHQP